jgi:hypothetical protein
MRCVWSGGTLQKVGELQDSARHRSPVPRQRFEKVLGGFVLRGGEELFGGGGFHDLALFEKKDPVRDFAREGDTLVIWKLDRLGRSLRDLIEIVNRLEKNGVSFVCITQNIDTRTPDGKLFFHIFGALAEYERELIRERTKAGLTAARARGRKGGRKPAMNEEQIEQARAMMDNPKLKIKSIMKTLGVSKATLYKYVPMGKSATENS